MTLELGGKSPSIVFADADLHGRRARTRRAPSSATRPGLLRALAGVRRAHRAAGVHGAPRGDGARRCGSATRSMRRTQMGPLISARQRERVAGYVDAAPVALQGSAPGGRGFWFPPTVLHPGRRRRPRGARGDLRPGRVRAAVRHRERGDRARQRHDLRALRARSGPPTARARLRVARALEIGALAINSYTSVRVGTPFGGFKQSGVGRELGADAAEAYTELKNVFLAT